MLKNSIVISTTALLLLSGCATKQPTQLPVNTAQNTSAIELKSEKFAGQTLTATAEVSILVNKIENLQSNSAYVELESNQNVKLGDFLNIKATPAKDGYLKLIIIAPNGERTEVLPNGLSQGYLHAHQSFFSNNEKFGLKATNPKGLHYVVVVFSEKNARMIMQQGMNGYNSIKNDHDFIQILNDIKNGKYGKNHISVFPMRVY